MDRRDRRNKQGKKIPRVPIKTYHWEDVRRSRRKGGYPWTHLYKKPFEETDFEDYTMDSLKRSKSTLCSTDTVEIQELSDDGRSTGENGTGIITEPDDHSFNEPSDNNEDKPDITNLESAESSDNISQYLDKEETVKPLEPTKETLVEETPKKTTLSRDSKISLTKMEIMKKLKEGKTKLKVPKLSLPISKLRKPIPKKSKSSPPQTKKEVKKEVSLKDTKPVYIHIPLKPPPGETDEFSYLEFEEKKEPAPVKKPIPKLGASFKDVVKSIKKLNEAKIQEETEEAVEGVKKVDEEKKNSEEIKTVDEKTVGEKEKAIEVDKGEEIKTVDEGKIVKEGKVVKKIDEEIEKSEEITTVEEEKPLEEDKAKPDVFEKLFAAGPSQQTEILPTNGNKKRAKSAEPTERKRKLSLESSYSRKSLSKLGILKKLKEAKDKIKFPSFSLSRSNSKKQEKKEKPAEVKEVKKAKVDELKKPKNLEPVYIHIPLKPPEGETDEFSHLAQEQPEEKPVKPVKLEEKPAPENPPESPESPESVPGNDVQFIFLTPPSDDEILDDHSPDIPETPLSETPKFFKIEDLKSLAKDVVDEISPETKRKKLLPVKEENNSDKSSLEDLEAQIVVEEKKSVVRVDEEDGLKLEDEEQTVKSSLKDDASPILKKKVSFKRRSKSDSKEGIYEDVQTSKEDKDLEKKQDNSGAKAEKVSSEAAKVIETTSLEEDSNKWSKLSDHEYEPVNPPPDAITIIPPTPLASQLPDQDQTSRQIPISKTSSLSSLDRRMLGGEEKPEKILTIDEITTTTTTTSKPAKTVTIEQTTTTTESTGKPPEGKFQKAFKHGADQLKSKLQGIKRPHLTMPPAPNLQRFKIQKPKFNLPKIPDTTRINLPKFSLPRRHSKRSLKERQQSTESNAGDSKKPLFDFSTYPRIFKRKPKQETPENIPAFATVPRKTKAQDVIRIPLHSEDSQELDLREDSPERLSNNSREDSVERRMMASHIRYDEDIDNDDEYERENQEIHRASPFHEEFNSRWNHGSFIPNPNRRYNEKVTDLDSPDEPPPQRKPDNYSSEESSLGAQHRRGVLEEINSDEFFLRQKGISQDDIDMGIYLSSEIREAFRTPTNALSQMQYEERGSNQSLPETTNKRKPIRKPKRKKTPHVSQEQIKQEDDSELEEQPPPSRPKRRSKRMKKLQLDEEVVPFQETISHDYDYKAKMGILDVDEADRMMYENEQMEGKEQPDIKVTDPYKNIEYMDSFMNRHVEKKPPAPPKRQKSLKSLNSEHASIMDDLIDEPRQYHVQNVELQHPPEDYIIPDTKPTRPSRTRSRTRSHSGGTPQPDDEETQSFASDVQIPCMEVPCVQDIRDSMGYAVIDKSKCREPPLPPPRIPHRHKRETKFFTMPKSLNDAPAPSRPLRNYSTLGQGRSSRSPTDSNNKENLDVDIRQYIEIEDEPNRDLQSGEVVQKMQNRPLPAPPRPPRKIRVLRDITSQENIMTESQEELSKAMEEMEVSTQTEPLPDDFECEETVAEAEDTVLTPSTTPVVRRELITPTQYSFEETVTHGTLLVEPLNGSRILPDSELTQRERIIPVTKDEDYDDDEDETSEIPESFTKLKDPEPEVRKSVQVVRQDLPSEVECLRAQKLQVGDLDVDRLTVNELLASRIVVSEIDSGNIQVNEIASKSGAIKVGDIELPPNVVQDIIAQLVALKQEEGQKKNSD